MVGRNRKKRKSRKAKLRMSKSRYAMHHRYGATDWVKLKAMQEVGLELDERYQRAA